MVFVMGSEGMVSCGGAAAWKLDGRGSSTKEDSGEIWGDERRNTCVVTMLPSAVRHFSSPTNSRCEEGGEKLECDSIEWGALAGVE